MGKTLHHLKDIFVTKGFRKGFAIAFGFHVLVTMVFSIGTLISRFNGKTLCFACENIKAVWNSIGFFIAAVVGVLTCPYELNSQFIHSISLVIYWALNYLLTPVLFGLLWGYVFWDEKKITKRFIEVFLIIYLPLSAITLYYLLAWSFGLTETNHCTNLSSMFP